MINLTELQDPSLSALVAGLATIAAILLGVLAIRGWRKAKSIESGLHFVGVRLTTDFSYEDRRYAWSSVQPILVFRNTCSHAQCFILDDCHVEIATRKSLQSDANDADSLEVLPGQELEIPVGRIDMEGVSGAHLSGHAKFAYRWGGDRLEFRRQ
jgi:hypothetical protein